MRRYVVPDKTPARESGLQCNGIVEWNAATYVRRSTGFSGQGELPMASDTASASLLIVRVATAALLSFALLLPANAQFWGDSWGRREQQPQQPYNPYGGFGGDRQWGDWGYRQRERPVLPENHIRA